MFESQRMRGVQAPIIPIVGDLIRQYPGTISLGQGVVHYGPPPEAAGRIDRFLADPENHKYKAVEGIAPLLDALAGKLRNENCIPITAGNRVVVTAGGNMAFMNAVLAIADAGDEIILLSPYYFNHEMAIVMAGCRAVLVPTDEHFQPRVDTIAHAITPRTRAVVTVSPNNPTGAVYPPQTLMAISALCRERGIFHISDEAYENFTYGPATHFSPASFESAQGHTISLFSLSKAYGFASWRIGYMVVPERLFVAVKKIQDTILICPPVISQFAALGALEMGSTYCRGQLVEISRARDTVLEEMRRVENCCVAPVVDGAFYLMMRVDTKLDALSLVERLVSEHGVAAIPGTAFGVHDGCSLRVSYGALRRETVVEGIGRFVKGIQAVVGA